MTELSITRGRDIELYIGDDILCGVTHFRAASRIQRREYFEYLNAEPYDAVPAGESHEIELTVLSLFADAIPESGSFTLRAVDGDTEYLYEGCTVIKSERDARGDKAVTDTYTLKALRLTKRRETDEG